MIKKIRRLISPKTQEMIFNSIPYRAYERLKLRNHKINFSCELTTRCNALCSMCSRSQLIKEKKLVVADMSKEIIEKILLEIKKMYKKGKKIYFSPMGLGEPLLYSGLFDLIRRIKNISKDIEVVITTNGILLDAEICKKLIDSGVDEVCISLNASNPKTYQKYMGIDKYKRVKKNAENLIILRNKSGQERPSIFIQYLSSGESFKKDISEWRKIMRYGDKCFVHKIASQAGFCPVASSVSKGMNYPCTQPLWRIAIKLNGDIYPCDPSFYSGSNKISSLYMGNILNTNVSDFSKRKEILEKMKKDDYSSLPECKKCDTYKLSCNCFFKSPVKINGKKWL